MTSLTFRCSSFFDLCAGDDVLLGDVRYIVQRSVRGGMGLVVLLLQDRNQPPSRIGALSSRLAVKAVLPEVADSEGIGLFHRELTVWAGFRHRNIIPLIEIMDAQDAGWVAAMDWCDGSLREILDQRGALPLKECTDILGFIIEGLAYAHADDEVLHLDLKPQNILYKRQRICLPKEAVDWLTSSSFLISDWGLASIKQPQLKTIAGSLSILRLFAAHF